MMTFPAYAANFERHTPKEGNAHRHIAPLPQQTWKSGVFSPRG